MAPTAASPALTPIPYWLSCVEPVRAIISPKNRGAISRCSRSHPAVRLGFGTSLAWSMPTSAAALAAPPHARVSQNREPRPFRNTTASARNITTAHITSLTRACLPRRDAKKIIRKLSWTSNPGRVNPSAVKAWPRAPDNTQPITRQTPPTSTPIVRAVPLAERAPSFRAWDRVPLYLTRSGSDATVCEMLRATTYVAKASPNAPKSRGPSVLATTMPSAKFVRLEKAWSLTPQPARRAIRSQAPVVTMRGSPSLFDLRHGARTGPASAPPRIGKGFGAVGGASTGSQLPKRLSGAHLAQAHRLEEMPHVTLQPPEEPPGASPRRRHLLTPENIAVDPDQIHSRGHRQRMRRVDTEIEVEQVRAGELRVEVPLVSFQQR